MAATQNQALEILTRKALKDFCDRNNRAQRIVDITSMSTPELDKRQARENEAKKILYRVHTQAGADFGKIFRVDRSVPNRTVDIYIGRAT